MKRQFFTWANQFTLLRLGLIPFFAVAVVEGHYAWALSLLVVAGVSDALDGLLARWLKQRTALGAYLDPITDKLLLSTAFVVLAVRGDIPWTLSVLVLGRDVLMVVVAGVIVVVAGFRPFPPSIYGKGCTAVQMLTVLTVVLGRVWPPAEVLWPVLLWLTAVLTVLTGVHYAYQTGKVLPR